MGHIYRRMERLCDAPKPEGLVDHRQPTETCVSHIMRPIHELNDPIRPVIHTRPYSYKTIHFYGSKSYYITLNTKHILKQVRSNIYIKHE